MANLEQKKKAVWNRKTANNVEYRYIPKALAVFTEYTWGIWDELKKCFLTKKEIHNITLGNLVNKKL